MIAVRRRLSFFPLMASVCAACLCGCAVDLLPQPPSPPVLLALDALTWTPTPQVNSAWRTANTRTLSVEQPRAVSGFGTRDMAYTRRAHEIEYFAHHQWIDTPAAMLAPLLVRALRDAGNFRAVTPASSAAVTDLRLETELVRMEQDFATVPSQMHLTLRAVLLDTPSRRVLGWREFDLRAPTTSDDAFGGASAANLLVQQILLPQVAAFVREAAPIAQPLLLRKLPSP